MGAFPDDTAPLAGPADVEMRFVFGDDVLMDRVADLCYETLHRPFGVSRQGDWGNLDPGSTHLVAVDADTVVGYGRLLVEGGWGHLRQVVVLPAYRRRGIASAIVRELVGAAARARLPRVYLNARLNAIGLYERAGFRVVSPEPFPMPRTQLPHVRMERDVP